ncbi:hypothetical protein C8A01DRAFT_51269 [Parachaetomium inaequale]|uniref:Uncharacterized protein n=1 Tax=Parachaetomium inaequale TaxID=2588326 RepID=A0AAN6P4Y9_9PEZI|nr:hypothetical protein C8A01DRAFT_51269 [Parachaetomium inaequale]
MESVKTSLSLLMVTAQFEAMVRSGNDNDRLKKRIRRLKRVIRHHLETMRDLRVQLDPARFNDAASYDSLDLDLTPEDTLEELGWSIYDHGTVPDSPRTSPSSSENHFNVRRAPPNPAGQPRIPLRIPTERRGSGTTPPPPPSMPSQPDDSIPSPRRVSPGRPPPPSNPASEASSPGIPARPLVSNTLRYRKENVGESIGGYVRSPRGALHQITASLVETLNGNIISIGTAQALGLEIEALGPDEGVMFDFGSGPPERSIGKVTFQWKVWDHINPRYPPLTVTCDVCENSIVGLILGRPFIQERERRWSKGGSMPKY